MWEVVFVALCVYVDATACEMCPLGMGVDLPGQPCSAAPGYSFWTRVREGDVISLTGITNTRTDLIDDCGSNCPVNDKTLFYNKTKSCVCVFGDLQNSNFSSAAVLAEPHLYNPVPQTCPVNYFKEDFGWGLCEPCPANMATTGDGAETCVQVYLGPSSRTRSLGVFVLVIALLHGVLNFI